MKDINIPIFVDKVDQLMPIEVSIPKKKELSKYKTCEKATRLMKKSFPRDFKDTGRLGKRSQPSALPNVVVQQ